MGSDRQSRSTPDAIVPLDPFRLESSDLHLARGSAHDSSQLRRAAQATGSPASEEMESRRGGGWGIVFGGRMSLLLAVRGEDAKANTSDGGRAAATSGAITQTQSPSPRQPATGSRSDL